jgi:hypothetical protein
MIARNETKKSPTRTQKATLFMAATAAVIVIALSSVPAGGSGAETPSSPAETINANVVSGPASIQVQAQRAANAPPDSATGEFTAHISLGPLKVLTLQGPVTCLDVRGDQAGLFYPITSSSPALFSDLHSGVFIYLSIDASGKPRMEGFLPVPLASTTSCPPGLALLPVTSGTATLTP